MGLNRYRPHVLVLPEDDADREIIIGFALESGCAQLQILRPAGGWEPVLEELNSDLAPTMRQFPNRHLVLVIDFDGLGAERLAEATSRVPADLRDRVFIVGPATEPEGLGSREAIGRALAVDCRQNTTHTWDSAAFHHNASELHRLRQRVSPILFQ